MNESKIKELFELCLRVSNETTVRASFSYVADDDCSRMVLHVFNDRGGIERHFTLSQFYDYVSEEQDFEEAKKYLLGILSTGKCPLNLEEESA